MSATVDLVYFDAGGGHRAAAQALQQVVQQQGRPWDVRLVDLFAVLDPQQTLKRRLGIAPQDAYNWRLSHGWTWGLAYELRLLQAAIGLLGGLISRRLQAHWRATRPDLVVSLVPNFNRPMYRAVRAACPGVPYVTVLTDLADHPPHFWIEPGQQQHLVCGSAHAVQQALAQGYAPAQITQASGMILRPAFHHPPPVQRDAELRALGLNPWLPVGLLMFGGHGAAQMEALARALPEVQLIVMCGHNQRLQHALQDLQRPRAHAAVGFTTEVPRYMQLADFFIGKPGPGSMSEAVQMGLPVVTFANARTLPQERFNADWVRDKGLGLVVDGLGAIPQAVAALLQDLPRWRRSVARQQNRAVFEVADVLAGLLLQGAPQATRELDANPLAA